LNYKNINRLITNIENLHNELKKKNFKIIDLKYLIKDLYEIIVNPLSKSEIDIKEIIAKTKEFLNKEVK